MTHNVTLRRSNGPNRNGRLLRRHSRQEKLRFLLDRRNTNFLEAKQKANIEAALVVLKASADCRLGQTSGEECNRFYKPRMQAIYDEGDLIVAQLKKVDECRKVYRSTIDKKATDLTVRETIAVKACQALDLYPLDMPANAKE